MSKAPLFALQAFVTAARAGNLTRAPGQLQLTLSSSVSLVDFDTDPVDAALRFGPGQWPGVIADHLFDDWLTPLASPELIKRLGRPKLDELSRWPLLGDPNNRWNDWFKLF